MRLHRISSADVHVDHAMPIHDAFCRCRVCKPPLVGSGGLEWTRKVELWALAGVVLVVMAVLIR